MMDLDSSVRVLINLRRKKEKTIRRLAQDEQARRRVRAWLLFKHNGRAARPNVADRACRLARTRPRPQRQARQAIRETETSSDGGRTRSGSANVDKSNQVREKQSENQRAWMRMDEETLQCSELQGHDKNETVIKSNVRRVRYMPEK